MMSTIQPGPVPLSPATRLRFQRQRSRDTTPEIALRSELHRRGRRYRVDVPPLPGSRRRADLVFTRAKVAVYVDGCFWHRCPAHGTEPKNNADWWRAKLDRNVARDREVDSNVSLAGWTVVRVWEHEDAVAAADRVEVALRLANRPDRADARPGPVSMDLD